MKKIRKNVSYSKNYSALKLFREDLDEIINIFKNNFSEFDIEIDEYIIDDISEIDEIKKEKTNRLSIETYENGYSYLNLFKNYAILNISDKNDTKLLGVFHQLDELISKKEYTFLKIITSSWVFYVMVTTIVIGLYTILWSNTLLISFIIIIIPFLLILLIILIDFHMTLKKHSIIYLIHSTSKIGFFERNKDQLSIGLICAIVGAIAGIMGTILIK